MDAAQKLPVTLLTGYLGAGKRGSGRQAGSRVRPAERR
jgi:hypothetical protein